MKRRLLDLLRCPRCHGAFHLEAFAEVPLRDAPADPAYASEIEEGALACAGCGARFPIIAGVPRLIGPALLARIARRYPDFFARHPELAPPAAPADDPLADTLESFTRQRLDLRPPGPEFARQWRAHLRRNLGGALTVEALSRKLVLDVGCGFGRHLYVANEAGAETVGVDLSGGVDVARANNRAHPRCHLVQANVLERPFRAESFDVVWSFGVLHHMPDPRTGFRAIVPLARPDGGLVVVWVYGYRGMAFTYRLSHMRPLHRALHSVSGPTRVRASKTVAAMLSGLYWARVCRNTLFITAALGVGCLLFGPFGIRVLYGPRFAGAIRPMLLMLPGIVMMSLYMILTRNFTSRNRQGVNIVAAGVALSVNVGLNCVLIPRWGISGAAISTAVSYSLAALMLLVVFVRESGHSVAETVLVGREEIGGYVRHARGLVPGAAAE